jgi:hypothetical protein
MSTTYLLSQHIGEDVFLYCPDYIPQKFLPKGFLPIISFSRFRRLFMALIHMQKHGMPTKIELSSRLDILLSFPADTSSFNLFV